MAIFGRRTARQRLRRATRESLAISPFSSPIDCAPRVTAGLWPAELSTPTAENSLLATDLKVDLEKITSTANDKLRSIRHAGMADSARQASEARVIDEARALAVRRVEATIRQLNQMTSDVTTEEPCSDINPDRGGSDTDETRVQPAVSALPQSEEPESSAAASSDPDLERSPDAPPAGPETEFGDSRLQRLLTFVARQEPRLSWAVAANPDSTPVLVTDLAHGWIPPDIAVPEGVRLLEPERRAGKVSALIGGAAPSVTYRPGDSLGWFADRVAPTASVRPRSLPMVEDLGRELQEATRAREGLPRAVHTLATAAAGGTRVIDDEIDLLRVYLDTARHQVLVQYPAVDLSLLLNCMLLAATHGSVTGDSVSANYHFAWFQKLNPSPAGK
ncbi:DUF5631 domain-containing protein [Mycobacterium spongiae]|uniref:Vegetative cell wall protein n=1 Tax=Mycobacterium spongiae TaxID=886343 RepID=A0A975JU24_9MYCO|nr:DUF5631 domain-containing protein [Mycobacterium spongiae]QUR65702.1 hypothetical protein F6B93_00190 [Mycobacterium spongiae]